MTNTVKRYEVVEDHLYGGTLEYLCPEGRWVKFEDHSAALEQAQKRIAELEAQTPATLINGLTQEEADRTMSVKGLSHSAQPIEPVYQRLLQYDEWQDIEHSEHVEFAERGKYQTRILYPASVVEALQAKNKQLNTKIQSLNFDNARLSTGIMDWQRLYEHSKA